MVYSALIFFPATVDSCHCHFRFLARNTLKTFGCSITKGSIARVAFALPLHLFILKHLWYVFVQCSSALLLLSSHNSYKSFTNILGHLQSIRNVWIQNHFSSKRSSVLWNIRMAFYGHPQLYSLCLGWKNTLVLCARNVRVYLHEQKT